MEQLLALRYKARYLTFNHPASLFTDLELLTHKLLNNADFIKYQKNTIRLKLIRQYNYIFRWISLKLLYQSAEYRAITNDLRMK